jgi:hypothetical protein
VKHLLPTLGVFLTLALIPPSSKAAEPILHDLRVVLYPEEQRFTVKDRITVPVALLPQTKFVLHKGLDPTSPTPGVNLLRETESFKGIPLESFRVIFPDDQKTFALEYGGTIHHPLEQTPGVISGEGVYLAGSSFWYPTFDERLVTFSLQVELPWPWEVISQGKRTLHECKGDRTFVQWESSEPHEEIHIVAAPFTEYRQPAGRAEAMVFLRTPDEGLATRYLEATIQYLAMYERLIGSYPYEKFALAENFWETGLGMASFTLLGPRVIRFPFILQSSYPHEILHNWWGNGVFPDYANGNWAEGLTAYLSDHLMKEMRGDAIAYRQETLQKYADYVLKGRDFPLSRFHSRHSTSSEAVGYGKCLMLFHMLRQELGDDLFVKALRDFFQKYLFQLASFDDLRKTFEAVSGRNLRRDFEQWVTRPGAPELRVSGAKARAGENGCILGAIFEQVQPGDAYFLRIPIAVTLENRGRAYQTEVVMDKKRLELKLDVPARPLRLDVDPEFDVFRRLDRDEIPPALTQALGAQEMLIVLPSSAGKDLLPAYRELSQALSQSGPGEVEVKLDTEVEKIPLSRAVTLFGWKNRFLGEIVSALSVYDVTINHKGVRIGPIELRRENHSVVLTTRQSKNKALSLTWIASDLPEAFPGLGRKLPHYHKYSYLAFQGDEPDNVAKGRWPVLHSPMTIYVPRKGGTISTVERGKLANREPLAALPPVFSKKRMMETVRFLSSDELQGRGLGTEGLGRAAEFIAEKFRKGGLKPAGDTEGSYFQTWQDWGSDPVRKVTMRNIVGVIPGRSPQRKAQSVVVGAHYDHLGLGWPDVRGEHRGKIHHGADDNASGIAVLIELAQVLGKSLKPDRSVVFVAFTGEEAGRKGSKYYVDSQKRYPVEQCIGMLNLDTVGRLGKKKLLVLGSGSAREWTHIFRGAGFVTGVELEAVSEELDSSDQKTFHEVGVPAVQLFSGPHLDYHRPTDTAEKIDDDGLLKVASVAKEVIEYLTGREQLSTNMLRPRRNVGSTTQGERKVSLGTIPDFAYTGEGCRLSGVVPGSPAESCGLTDGDVIVRVNSSPVRNLRDLSDILKSLNPRDRVSITILREGKEISAEAEVVGR